MTGSPGACRELEQEAPFGQWFPRQHGDCIGDQVNGFQVVQNLLRAMRLAGLQLAPGLTGRQCELVRTRQYTGRFVVPVPHPGLNEFKKVPGDIQRQRVVQFRSQPGVDAQFFRLFVKAARVMEYIQVDFRCQREYLAPDFWFPGMDEDDVNIGSITHERIVGAQGPGQVGCHQVGIREGALLGGFFGNTD